MTPWPSDPAGRLWSAELGLWLVAQEREIRAALPDGPLLPTLRESEQARRAAEQRAAAEQARADLAEAELVRLRAELRRASADPDSEPGGTDAC